MIILCLEYLHSKNILFRNLKPESFCINECGYLQLTDLSISKITSKEKRRTYTIVGSPHYMAPEMTMGKGYSLTSDFWSLGICLYELMCGKVAFGED